MDLSTLKDRVGFPLPRLAGFLALWGWRINASYDRLDGSLAAQVYTDPDYHQARVVLDSDKFDDEDDVVAFLAHELFHLVAAPFDLYEAAVLAVLKDLGQPAAAVALKAISAHAHERAVGVLERIWEEHLRDLYLDLATRPPGDAP